MSRTENPNFLFKRVGRNPVAKALAGREFHQRVVPAKKKYDRREFKRFQWDAE